MSAAPVPVLLYHSVGYTISDRYRRWIVSPSDFAEQLDVVTELGFTCLTVSDYVDRRDASKLPERPLLVTFDDGRADVVRHAVPALVTRGMPATVYLVSGYIGGSSAWLDDSVERCEPMMSWSDAADLTRVGIEIGAHSHRHRELDVLPADQRRFEIVHSRATISDRIGSEVTSFAYPHGYHSRTVAREVAQAGFRSACAVKDCWSSHDDDRYALSRLIVSGGLGIGDFRSLLLGRAGRRTSPRHGAVSRCGWRGVRWARQRWSPRA